MSMMSITVNVSGGFLFTIITIFVFRGNKMEIMSQVEKYYKIAYENPVIFSVLVAVLLPFTVMIAGMFINLVGEALATIIGLFLAPSVASAIVNYLMFPGVMLHELAHALFALLTGAKVTEVALFKKEGDSLGHVNFHNRGNIFVVALQNIFTSSAPMFVGAAVVYACFYFVGHLSHSLLWLKILLGYIGVSMFFHMTMSPEDIRVYVKGIPLFIVIVFVVTLILRLTGIL